MGPCFRALSPAWERCLAVSELGNLGRDLRNSLSSR